MLPDPLPGDPKVKENFSNACRLIPGGLGPDGLARLRAPVNPTSMVKMSPTKRARGLAPFPHFPENISAREDSGLCPGVMPSLFVSSGGLSRDLPCAARLWQTRDSSPGCKTLDGHQHLAQREHRQEARQSRKRQDKGEVG